LPWFSFHSGSPSLSKPIYNEDLKDTKCPSLL
jgi:hypothetical protein